MIIVINLNLAIDAFLEVDELRPGALHRASAAQREAGGKGVNVARVLRTLGEPGRLSGFLGGRSGEFIAARLSAEAIEHLCVRTRGESRTCFILSDGAGRQTVINEPGAEISREESAQFLRTYEGLIGAAELILITGSLPPGLPADFYARLTALAQDAGCRVLIDCAPPALAPALAARPFMVKINQHEAGALLDRPITNLAEAANAATLLMARGARCAMVTLGAAGAALAAAEARYLFTPPLVEARNTVGCGDAVAAGVAVALRRGFDLAELGRLAMAAGAANARHGAGRCTSSEISLLQPQVICRRAE